MTHGDFQTREQEGFAAATWHLALDRLCRAAGLAPHQLALVEAGVWAADDGQLWSAIPGRRSTRRLIPQERNGYLRAGIYRRGKRHWVYHHRAVANAFMWPPPPDKQLVCHIDGNSLNNRLSNLKWGSHQDNADDRTIHEMERAAAAFGLPELPRYDPYTLGLDGDDWGGELWPMVDRSITAWRNSRRKR